MKRKRFSEAQIIGVLKEAEAGIKKQDLCRQAWDHRADVLPVALQVRGPAGVRRYAAEAA